MNIYVGNLPSEVSEDEISTIFKPCGEIDKVSIIKDRASGESRGFGFVEMPNQDEALEAINELNGVELKGKQIIVNEARPRAEKVGGGRSSRGSGQSRVRE